MIRVVSMMSSHNKFHFCLVVLVICRSTAVSMPAVTMWTLLVISAPLVLSQHAEEAAEASPPACGGYYGQCNIILSLERVKVT